MKCFQWVWCGVAALVLGGGQGAAWAQFQDVPTLQTPVVSPYLNLFRGGSNAALNYLDIVRPQLQTQNNFQTLQLQQQQIIQRQLSLTTPTTGGQATPHVPGYMTHGKYFMNGGTLAAGTGKVRKSLSDRRTNTEPTQTAVPASTGTGTVANQTRTVFPTNNFSRPFSPSVNPSFTPFNPYRGF